MGCHVRAVCGWGKGIAVAAALLTYGATAQAQTSGGMGATSTSGGLSGGFGLSGSSGGSSGGFGFGSSSGGSSGLTSGQGGFGQSSAFSTSPVSGTSATSAISPSNPFNSYFNSPLYTGTPATRGKQGGFGLPLFTTTTSGTAATYTGSSGVGGIGYGGSGAGGAPQLVGRRGPALTIGLDFAPRPIAAAQVRTDLQAVLARSTALSANRDIQVVMDGATVVLRGRVSDERARRLAEGLVRLTPGVRMVRNELAVPMGPPAPTAAP